MRTINATQAEPGGVLHGVYPGHDMPLPELDEQVIVFDCWRGLRFHSRVIGLNHGLHTYAVKVGEMILEEPE